MHRSITLGTRFLPYLLFAVLCCPWAPAPAHAGAGPSSDVAGHVHALDVAGLTSLHDAGAEIGYQFRTPAGILLGARARLGRAWEHRIVGWKVGRALDVQALATARFPVYRGPNVTFGLQLEAGVGWIRADESTLGPRSSTSILTGLGFVSDMRLGPIALLQLAVHNPVFIEVKPEVVTRRLANLLAVGLSLRVAAPLRWFAETRAGPSFGADGDGFKFLFQATTGFRLILGPATKQWPSFRG